MKKHVVEYTTVNPVYAESRGMFKAAIVFVVLLIVLSLI